MTTRRTPGLKDFQRFFTDRVSHLQAGIELVWLSDTIPVDALRAAYPLGVFPWPGDEPEIFPWVCPEQRGVLPLIKFRLGRSTRRALQRSAFQVTFDQAFEQVIEACHHMHDPNSWIHPRMREAYKQAHQQGFARSVEVWQEGELVGGLYGIDSGILFSGESMFHHRSNAGKAAVAALVEELKHRDHTVLDIQQLTPHMQSMGAEEWPRETFLRIMNLSR